MVTTNIGRIFLQAYNAKYNKKYTAREFFDEVFYPLVFDANIGHRTTRIQRRGVEKEVKLFIFRRLVVCL